MTLRAIGEWVRHLKYGRQFKATQIDVSDPSDLIGYINLLATTKIPGLGPANAKKLVDHWGLDVLQHLGNADDLKRAGILNWLISDILDYHLKNLTQYTYNCTAIIAAINACKRD